MPSSALPPELDLLLACGSPSQVRVSELLDRATFDWPKLIDLAGAHGMLPLLSRALWRKPCPLPEEALAVVRARTAACAMRSLFMAGELARVLAALQAAGVTGIAFKGATLAWLAYGDLALRDSTDLDIFVPRGQLQTALDLLAADGYGKKTAAWDTGFSGACEIALQRCDPGCEIDLHWHFSSPYFLDLDPVRAVERSIVLRIAGLTARTLCPEDLLLYLCIHAAREGWGLVRFPCDMAGVIARCALDWDEVIREARRTGCWRALATGLDLAHELCEAPVPLEVLERVKRDRAVSGISAQAFGALCRQAPNPDGSPGGALLHLRMMEGLRGKARYIWRRALQPNQMDAEWIRLPRPLFAAYYLVRPVRVACVALGRMRQG
jgi:hypothetical protein